MSETAEQTTPFTALVVDDDDDLRELISHVLVSLGLRVVAARSAAEARERLAADSIDLVLTDYAMPGEDGIDLLRSIGEDEHRRALPCVMISGQGDAKAILGDVPTGGSLVFLRKPFSISALAVLVRRALATRQQQKKEQEQQQQKEPPAEGPRAR